MKVFLENREKVAEHNARFAKGEETFTLAMNKFGDLLTHELLLFTMATTLRNTLAREESPSSSQKTSKLQPASTGDKADTLLPSRTRNNADPAGLSQLSVLWKDKTSVKLDTKRIRYSRQGPETMRIL